ncbi:methyl-accepting chemotaxis protein [Bacterioplanoides sp.]|uniref:methyl-accepting chemotaxis protein n=1 Tax=Bacterioplanoides sp. TaxID=2066072 RepID=UPI003B003BE6
MSEVKIGWRDRVLMNISLKLKLLLPALLACVLGAFQLVCYWQVSQSLPASELPFSFEQFAAVTVLMLAFIIFVAISVSQNIMPLLEHIISVMKIIAAGKLNQRIGFSGSDEFGRIGNAVDSTIEQLVELIGKVTDTAEDIVQQTHCIDQLSVASQQELSDQHRDLSRCTSAVSESSQVAGESAVRAEKADGLARQIHAGMVDMNRELNQVTEQVNLLQTDMTHSVDAGQTLRQTSKQVRSVLDVINGISEQTNLLALNAAIEAARAGEAGRGFAVVADQVRALSIQTQDATVEIQAMIANLEKTSELLVESISAGDARVTSMVSVFGHSHESVTTISADIDELAILNQQTAQAVISQRDGANIMLQEIEQVQKRSAECLQNMASIVTACDSLSTTSTSLNQATRGYSVS